MFFFLLLSDVRKKKALFTGFYWTFRLSLQGNVVQMRIAAKKNLPLSTNVHIGDIEIFF